MKFRKKPVVIEAVQFTGVNAAIIKSWAKSDAVTGVNGMGELMIVTLEGTMFASTNDWIIRGVKGEYYPCKPDIFAATYEAVDEQKENQSQQVPSFSNSAGMIDETLEAFCTQYQFRGDAIVPRNSPDAPTIKQLGLIRSAHLNIYHILKAYKELLP